MSFNEAFDEFLTDCLARGLDEAQIALVIANENFWLEADEEGNPLTILEAVKRIKRKIGGVNITVRKIGRKDPRRSQIMKMAARKGRAKRAAAMRNPRTKAKQKRARAILRRMRPRKAGARKPKRAARPRRPVIRRPKLRRPKPRRSFAPRRRR
jgi:hypothetical protein